MTRASHRLHRAMTFTALAGAALLAACTTTAPEPLGCPDSAQVADMLRRYVALEPLPTPPQSLTVEAGLCGRAKFEQALAGQYGRVVGYKAGLTNPAVQQRFNYPQPVRGTLYERMMLSDGAQVPARYGARPVYEADLVVEVGSSAIHEATTPAQVLASLYAVRPFIELPDLMLEDPTKIGGASINLINVGARLGVLGAAIPVAGNPGLNDALSAMTVRVIDADGKQLDTAPGTAILGHPLNAVIWLAGDLRKSGITLKPGDLLSLGSFSRALTPQAGQDIRVVYEGLPGNPAVSVKFR